MAPMGIVGGAFAAGLTQAERDQAWQDALTDDIVWEAPFTEPPIKISGRRAVGEFFDWLIYNVPEFKTELDAVHFVESGNAYVVQVTGGGPTRDGDEYRQKYFSLITVRDGKIASFLEHFKVAETYRAFGRDNFHGAIEAIIARNLASA
jgi:ketosteroid isomerase-like protein